MADVPTLIERIELLIEGEPLPGDDAPSRVLRNVGAMARNTAAIRCMNPAVTAQLRRIQPIDPRLACELVDNVDTILAGLRAISSKGTNNG